MNPRPLGYEPNELPDCSTPQYDGNIPAYRPSGQGLSEAMRPFIGGERDKANVLEDLFEACGGLVFLKCRGFRNES